MTDLSGWIANRGSRTNSGQPRESKRLVASEGAIHSFLLSYRSRIILHCLIFTLKASTQWPHGSRFGVQGSKQNRLAIQSLKRKFARESNMSQSFGIA